MAVLTRGQMHAKQVQSDVDNGQLLPDPKWGCEPGELSFPSEETFEFFMREVRRILESELETHHYNTFGSFLAFYDTFKQQSLPLEDFFRGYYPGILEGSLSCVGLGCSLATRLLSSLGPCYPLLPPSLFLASCEEMVSDVDSYTSSSPPSLLSLKEHVLVVLRVRVGDRPGHVLLDPGYHVCEPVVVMRDGLRPHTGWFEATRTPKATKEYLYCAEEGGAYVRWHVAEKRPGEETRRWTNLVFVARKFLSCARVSEKRNLVFNYRTLVARDRRGPVAGVYCNLEGEERLTFFYEDGGLGRRDVKIPYEYFEGEGDGGETEEEAVRECVARIRGFDVGTVRDVLKRFVRAFRDPEFMPFVRSLNLKIDEE